MKRDAVNIQIRTAQPENAEAISAVLNEAFREYAATYTSGGFAATTPTPAELRIRMNEGPVWIAVNGDKVVGTVSAVLQGKQLYIRGMGIIPTARGQWIGEMLLQQIEEFANEHGVARLYLSTTPFLSRAIKLYESFGFAKTDDGPDDLFGTPLITMQKLLASKK